MMEQGKLTVTRVAGQHIVVGSDIVVNVLSVRNNRAKVQVVAPKNVTIVRGEVIERRMKSNGTTAKEVKHGGS